MTEPYGDLALGKHTEYPDQYAPQLLTAIPRRVARESLGLDSEELPFQGEDIWTAFELSWLNKQGRPSVATAQLRLSCDSPSIVESKSLKLYLNSLNQSVFSGSDEVAETIQRDLSACAGSDFPVSLLSPASWQRQSFFTMPGKNIDDLHIATDKYLPDAGLLKIEQDKPCQQAFNSNLFRSLCPVTAQPDWASVWIDYCGPGIVPESLLQYLVSYRKHQGFHEQCVEKIFLDLMRVCEPERLTVTARFTRRGGLDINPVRSTHSRDFESLRLFRQ